MERRARSGAVGFAESLQRNVSLYFPFLAYYQISYYRYGTEIAWFKIPVKPKPMNPDHKP